MFPRRKGEPPPIVRFLRLLRFYVKSIFLRTLKFYSSLVFMFTVSISTNFTILFGKFFFCYIETWVILVLWIHLKSLRFWFLGFFTTLFESIFNRLMILGSTHFTILFQKCFSEDFGFSAYMKIFREKAVRKKVSRNKHHGNSLL